MATVRFGISKTEQQTAVTIATGAAMAAKDVEVTFDLAAGLTRDDLIVKLDQIKWVIMSQNTWPPAP